MLYVNPIKVKPMSERSDEECMQLVLPRLKNLRDDYSNEIPDKIIHSCDDNNKYKCRMAWFQMWYFSLGELGRRGILSDQLVDTIELFQGHFDYTLRITRGKVTPELIGVADTFISETIKAIESRLSPI